MTREEIRVKHAELTKKWVEAKGEVSKELNEEFHKLKQAYSHSRGEFNYEIDFWACPDCGLRK
jgi:hypothetical protein